MSVWFFAGIACALASMTTINVLRATMTVDNYDRPWRNNAFKAAVIAGWMGIGMAASGILISVVL